MHASLALLIERRTGNSQALGSIFASAQLNWVTRVLSTGSSQEPHVVPNMGLEVMEQSNKRRV